MARVMTCELLPKASGNAMNSLGLAHPNQSRDEGHKMILSHEGLSMPNLDICLQLVSCEVHGLKTNKCQV